MMEHEERIRLLISMQEHPERYSDEQLQQMLAEDPELSELLDELALTKQAFVKREADEEAIPVEAEWGIFYAKHGKELKNVGTKEWKNVRKLAASIIGILFTVGMTFAAVHFARMGNTSKQQIAQTEQPVSALSDKVLPTDTLTTDTTTTAQPIVFDNAPLEKILSRIAAYYHKEVVFANDDTRLLRFYLVWKPEEGLEATLHRLNLFERINIELNDNKIVVK